MGSLSLTRETYDAAWLGHTYKLNVKTYVVRPSFSREGSRKGCCVLIWELFELLYLFCDFELRIASSRQYHFRLDDHPRMKAKSEAAVASKSASVIVEQKIDRISILLSGSSILSSHRRIKSPLGFMRFNWSLLMYQYTAQVTRLLRKR